MNNISKLTLALLLTLLIFVSCKDSNNSKLKSKEGELIEVSTRIKWFAYASYIGTYTAKDWGFFKEEGLDVTINEGGPQVDATKLVASGSNDFGICGGDQLVIARSKGLPVVAIAALMQESPAGYMVLENSDIFSMKDFPGHTIRIIPGHNTDIEYRAVMQKLRVNTKKEMKEIVNFTQLQLLLEGKVDIEPIYLNNQPSLADYKNIKYRTFTPTDYGVRSYGNVYFTTEKMIKEHPEIVHKFLKAIIKGWEQSFQTPEQAVDSLITHAESLIKEVELDKLKRTYPLMERKDNRFGMMEFDRWNRLYQDLLETNVIKDSMNVKDFYNSKFINDYYDK